VTGADPADRFTGRVDDYTRYRPGYPAGLVELLRRECGIGPGSEIADVGSGTGKLSECFLPLGCTVYGVEPNPEMRREAERRFAGSPSFVSVAGRAEATGLPGGSVDLAAAGQAFHWFDPAGARAEFSRILRGKRAVALAWNWRRDQEAAFNRAWEEYLVAFSVDYAQVADRNSMSPQVLAGFFDCGRFERTAFPNPRRMDREGLRGLYRSCSYALPPAHPRYPEAMRAMDALFERHAAAGTVEMANETVLYLGTVGAS
jgi:SAM-dependent methyltransferase